MKEIAEINKVMDKIYQDLGIEVMFLSKPGTIEEAWKLYHYLKKQKEEDIYD